MSKVTRGQIAEMVERPDFGVEILEQLNPRIGDATVAIVAEQNGIVQHGTGTLLRIADRYFLVSAAHVLRQAHDGQAILFLGSQDDKGLLQLYKNFQCVRADRFDDSLDVAVSELDQEMVDHLGAHRFLGLMDIVTQDCSSEEDIYLVTGYPTAIATKWQPGQSTMILPRWSLLTALYTGKKNFTTYQKGHNILLQRSGNTVSIGELDIPMPPKLEGISGGGIWKTNYAALQDGWTADKAKLVAVETSVFANAIKGTSFKAVAKLICQAYPELRPSFELYLPK